MLEQTADHLRWSIETLRKSVQAFTDRGQWFMAKVAQRVLDRTQGLLALINRQIDALRNTTREKRDADHEGKNDWEEVMDKLHFISVINSSVTSLETHLNTVESSEAKQLVETAVGYLKSALRTLRVHLFEPMTINREKRSIHPDTFKIHYMNLLNETIHTLRLDVGFLSGSALDKAHSIFYKMERLMETINKTLLFPIPKRDTIGSSWSSLLESQMAKLNETVARLNERMQELKGEARNAAHTRIESLKGILDAIRSRIQKREKRSSLHADYPKFYYMRLVNESINTLSLDVWMLDDRESNYQARVVIYELKQLCAEIQSSLFRSKRQVGLGGAVLIPLLEGTIGEVTGAIWRITSILPNLSGKLRENAKRRLEQLKSLRDRLLESKREKRQVGSPEAILIGLFEGTVGEVSQAIGRNTTREKREGPKDWEELMDRLYAIDVLIERITDNLPNLSGHPRQRALKTLEGLREMKERLTSG